MSEIEKINNIILPEIDEFKSSVIAVTSDEASSTQITADGSAISAQVNAGSLCVFDNTLTNQNRSDISNSILFAQLAANAAFDRFAASGNWLKKYFEVLGVVGWNKSAFNNSDMQIPSPVDWEKVVIDGLEEKAAELAKAVMKAAQSLKLNSNAMNIWNANAIGGNSGNFQIIPATLAGGSVRIVIIGIVFQFETIPSGFLSWNFMYTVVRSISDLELNEDVYAKVRDAIIKKLEGRQKNYISAVSI